MYRKKEGGFVFVYLLSNSFLRYSSGVWFMNFYLTKNAKE